MAARENWLQGVQGMYIQSLNFNDRLLLTPTLLYLAVSIQPLRDYPLSSGYYIFSKLHDLADRPNQSYNKPTLPHRI